MNRLLYYHPKPAIVREDRHEEAVDMPESSAGDNLYIPPAEAERALRDLIGGGINHQGSDVEIDMSQAIVPGFNENIELLPHQVLGRQWMKEREDPETKKFGGILADDMGLGKTIQALTRIVEGRPHKSDRADGWAPATLVVCPVSLIGQWASEIEKMAKGLIVTQHHGPTRTSNPERLKQAHVVITSYSTIVSEHSSFRSQGKDESKTKKDVEDSDDSDSDSSVKIIGRSLPSGKKTGKTKEKKDALFRLKWWRIILDEAHNIKNRTTKTALACCGLEAKFRWCLSGTPMQNNVEEVYSLFKFLRVRPLNDWSKFKDQIAQPLKTGRGANTAMKRLQVVLEKVMLRRQKDQLLNGQPLIILPARNVKIVECEFDSTEKAFYRKLADKMESTVNKLMEQERGANYTSVLLLLLRLRQACNHPCLVSKDYLTDQEAVDPQPQKTPAGDESEELADLFSQLGVAPGRKCQVCQVTLTEDDITADKWETHCLDCAAIAKQAKACSGRPDSAKIRMILKLLREIEQRSNREEKTIIFSQFTSMLNLLEPFLKDEGIAYVRYDGKMSKVDRDASLEKIRTSKRTRCILISFKAGGTGLNLTACNNVILADLWWNPALEDQAFDRAHRFGQTRDVHIFKLMIPRTVEERIIELQEKKRELARAALSGDKIRNLKLGLDDLMALFKGGRDDSDDEETA